MWLDLHKASLGLPRALNNAAIAALIAATTTGRALVDEETEGQIHGPVRSVVKQVVRPRWVGPTPGRRSELRSC